MNVNREIRRMAEYKSSDSRKQSESLRPGKLHHFQSSFLIFCRIQSLYFKQDDFDLDFVGLMVEMAQNDGPEERQHATPFICHDVCSDACLQYFNFAWRIHRNIK